MEQSQENPGYLVIGQELAAARKSEEERVASGAAGASPLTTEMRYDADAGDCDLLDPSPVPLDATLTDICQRFAKRGPQERTFLRSSCCMRDFYTLLTFNRRSAVFAWRLNESHRIAAGLTAVAIIELKRVDFRDVICALCLLYNAACGISADADDHFNAAAALAEPATSDILGFLQRSEGNKSVRAMGFMTVETKSGIGLINCDSSPYAPTLPLFVIARAIAEMIRRDEYVPTITLATSLPKAWLWSRDHIALERVLARARAGATIGGATRHSQLPDHLHRFFMIFLIETAVPSDANVLVKLTETKSAERGDSAMLGINVGNVFSLAVAKSILEGQKSFETQQSIMRFADGLLAILSNYCTNKRPRPSIALLRSLRGWIDRRIS